MTFARLNEREVAARLCEMVLSNIGPTLPGLDTFVALTTALKLIDLPRLTASYLNKLDMKEQLRTGFDTINRKHQAIQSYCELLDLYGEQKTVLGALDSFLAEYGADELVILQRAIVRAECEDLQGSLKDYQSAIATARQSVHANPDMLRHILSRYATFLSYNPTLAKIFNVEEPDTIFLEAASLSLQLDHGYADIMNYWATFLVHRNPSDLRGAQGHYEKAIAWCNQKGAMAPGCLLNYAQFLLRWGDQNNHHRGQSCKKAEELCWILIEDQRTDWRWRLRAYQLCGRIVSSGKRYRGRNNRSRPDKSDGIELVRNGFESTLLERDDDNFKAMEDIRSHRALGEIYSRWADEDVERCADHRRNAEFHFKKSFSGLPRLDLKGPRIDRVLRQNKQAYERFKNHIELADQEE